MSTFGALLLYTRLVRLGVYSRLQSKLEPFWINKYLHCHLHSFLYDYSSTRVLELHPDTAVMWCSLFELKDESSPYVELTISLNSSTN